MLSMRPAIIACVICACTISIGRTASAATERVIDDPTQGPLIEIAILLDTSGSMSGLIDQARQRLWAIVDDLARTRRDGQVPDLRVALYHYGNSGLDAASHFIAELQPLSHDLDALSERLFALTTNGGEEYCGAVIDCAVANLGWHQGDHFRAIFIAGNEPFDQGPVDFRAACKRAASLGIVVNTIHCGDAQAQRQGYWDEAPRLADGEAFNIDHNHEQVAIAAPQDALIADLNRRLNDTYIAFGAEGAAKKLRQESQDYNAASLSPDNLSQRAASKASAQYRNGDWDLVDALNEGTVDLAALPEDQLPEELRGLDAEGRAAWIAEKKNERAAIQVELRELADARRAYVTEERRKQAASGAPDTFGDVVRSALATQLEASGYTVDTTGE